MIPDPFTRDQDGADALVEGHYLIQRYRAQRVAVPVRIWFGAPIDEDGVELDRSPRWQIQIAGELLGTEPLWVGGVEIADLSDFWPACAAHPIDENDYRYRIERQCWASQFDDRDPFGTPGGRVDPMSATLPFMEPAR